MTLSRVAEITGGSLHGADRAFSGVGIDSRAIGDGELFVAIAGENFDGHDFVAAAVARGAAGALVVRAVDAAIDQVTVDDTTLALGKLAADWRRQYRGPVIGITGSNGKTTVTAMVRDILAVSGNPLAPRESFNNQWGVPLTLLALRDDHSHAVIEMGMNHPGEIDYLADIAKPDVALINNAAAAHLEGLGSVERVADAKGEILDHLDDDGVAVLNRDDAFCDHWRERAGQRRVITFGQGAGADIRARGIETIQGGMRFELTGAAGDAVITLGVPGRHNVMNALAAITSCHAVGVALADAVTGIALFAGTPGRLRRSRTAAGGMLIDDSFNANPASIAAAIDVLAETNGRKVLVLGAMAELGADAATLHAGVGRQARDAGLDRLLVLDDNGNPVVAGYAKGWGAGAEVFATVDDLVAAIGEDAGQGSTILVKGSKSSRMGRVVRALEAGQDGEGEPC